ncbi:ATP-binding protein [Streptomyces sp. ID05-26A]|nr:ATP-binding protein [Streptomyces sp. ID05-26A]
MPDVLEARLLATVSRLAGPVRGAGVVLISLFGAFSLNSPLGWSLCAAVAVSSVADFRFPRVALPVAFLRVVLLSVLLGADADQWVLTVLTTTLITWQWQWSWKISVPATAALLAVQVVTTGPGVLVRAVLESVLARLAYELLRRSSRRVDLLRERAASQNRAAAVALDQVRRERDYLALLHDTAASTFLMAAHGGDPSEVAAQARRDLVVLAEQGDAQGTVDLGAALTAVARDSSLDVRVVAEVVPVPAGVALQFVRAVRELLTNVERHAGTGVADLAVTRERGAVVVVEDAGRGFVPAEVPEHRRGLRGSVVERLEAVGGAVVVESGAAGTTVRLEWVAGDRVAAEVTAAAGRSGAAAADGTAAAGLTTTVGESPPATPDRP